MADKRNTEGYPDPTAYRALRKIEKEERRRKPFVYICSPYAGDTEHNAEEARRYSRFAYNRGTIPVVPHLMYSQFLESRRPGERRDALFMARLLLNKCDEVWVFGGEISDDMEQEILAARKKYQRKKRVRYFTKNCMEVQKPPQPASVK